VEMDTTRQGSHAPATSEVLDGLNDLLQLDHDAIGAYEIAMEKLEDRDAASQIAGFLRDHERHVRDLNELIQGLGGVPKNEPHATGPLKEALQSIGGLAGDKGILMAWRTNELQVRTKYDTYASRANAWPHDVKRVIDRNALDEERHYQWVSDALALLGVGGDGSSLRERAADAVGSVREKVSAGAGAVANRLSGMFDPEGDGRLAPVGQAAARVRGGVGDAGDRAGELVDRFEDQVRESPVQTLLVAAVAGFVIGRLLRQG
jgi:rubrerythrin